MKFILIDSKKLENCNKWSYFWKFLLKRSWFYKLAKASIILSIIEEIFDGVVE